MSTETTENVTTNRILTTDLFGRRVIYTPVEQITEENVIEELNSAMVYHVQNMTEEERLYWYRRGVQPILNRKKERNKFITNFVVMNTAAEIVDFKNGYFLTSPCSYVSRNEEAQEKVEQLNEYLYRSGKQECDNQIADWFHTVGKGVLYVEPTDDKEVPLKCYSLMPMNAFVVYSLTPGNKPVYAVSMVVNDATVYYDVWTKDRVFRLKGQKVDNNATNRPDVKMIATELVKVEPNILGHIPIIEYSYNRVNMGAFEAAICLLDELNNIQSNRVDGIEQFIQSLLIITNAELEDGENAETIKERGILLLKSTQELTAKVEMLTQQLDQSQTQTLVNDIYEHILTICAMPRTNTGGTGSGANGVAILARDGWYQADCAARNTGDLFREANRQFDEIIVDILKRKNLLDISLNDFDLNIARNETANIQSKAQAFNTLLASGLHPELAAAKSGISSDPVSDIAMSEKYLKLIWGDPDNPMAEGQDAQTTTPGMGGNGQAPQGGNKGVKAGGKGESNNNTDTGMTWIEGYWQKRDN